MGSVPQGFYVVVILNSRAKRSVIQNPLRPANASLRLEAMCERKRTKPVRWRETMSFPTTQIIQIRAGVPCEFRMTIREIARAVQSDISLRFSYKEKMQSWKGQDGWADFVALWIWNHILHFIDFKIMDLQNKNICVSIKSWPHGRLAQMVAYHIDIVGVTCSSHVSPK